jgi:hypothetical protein
VRNSSLVEWSCAENVTGLNMVPKLGLPFAQRCAQSKGKEDFAKAKSKFPPHSRDGEEKGVDVVE